MIRRMRMLGLLLVGLWVMIHASLPVSAASKLAAGTYTMDYVVLRAEDDSVSIANDYWEKPATVTASSDGYTVRMTLNHSKWIVAFSVPSSSGSYAAVKKISEDTKEDKRVIEFKTDDLSKPIEAKIHVIVEEIGYNHKYTIRLSFDENSASLIKAAEEKAPEKETAAVEKGNEEKSPAQSTTSSNTTSTTPSKPAKNDTASTAGSTSGKSEGKATSSQTVETTKPAQTGTTAGTTTKVETAVKETKTDATKATETASKPEATETVSAEPGADAATMTTDSAEGTTADAAPVETVSTDSTETSVETAEVDDAGAVEDTSAAVNASEVVETAAPAPEEAVFEEDNGGSRIVNGIVFLAVVIAAGAVIVWVKRRKQGKGI